MTRIILILSAAMVLFLGAAGLSWYLQPQTTEPEGAEHKEGSTKVAKTTSKKDHPSKIDKADVKSSTAFPNNPDAARLSQGMQSMQLREEKNKEREMFLITREKQLTAIHEDIKKEHAKLDLVRKEIQTELNHVKKMMDEVELRAAAVAKEKRDVIVRADKLKEETITSDKATMASYKANAPIYDKMESEALSRILNEWLNTGKTSQAAMLLQNMKQSQAAGALVELEKLNPMLAGKVVELLQKIQTSPAGP